jgi:tRNA(adenine34) deaminase
MFMQDTNFMQRAFELAKYAASIGEVPVGAVLVLENEIIGEGWNCPITVNDPTAHAEIIALRKGAEKLQNYRLLNTILYVTLEPCAMCVGAMLYARVKRLVFGADDPKAGAVRSVFKLLDESKLNHRIEYEGGLMAEECGALLQAFFKEKR